MGILNVTPDSFSDGGRFLDPEAAVRHGLALAADGADLVDVGGESTRPGARPVVPAEEQARVVPVVQRLAAAGIAVSIDTRHAETARAAVDAGACVINDVSGFIEPAMVAVARVSGAGLIVMHMRGEPATMQSLAVYTDVVEETAIWLEQRLEELTAAGIDRDRIALDPGLGFAKTAEHNVAMFNRLERLTRIGRPLVIGASRKSFLGMLTGRPVGERLAASLAAACAAAAKGAHLLRVHDVRETVDALRVWSALMGMSP
jgi:dihydropteroate synthase